MFFLFVFLTRRLSAVFQWAGDGDGAAAQTGEQPLAVEYAGPQQPCSCLRRSWRRGARISVEASERRWAWFAFFFFFKWECLIFMCVHLIFKKGFYQSILDISDKTYCDIICSTLLHTKQRNSRVRMHRQSNNRLNTEQVHTLGEQIKDQNRDQAGSRCHAEKHFS